MSYQDKALSFSSLPSELISNALVFLPVESLQAVSLTSRRFYSESKAETLWYLRCVAAGVEGVAPASSSWASFARRLGVGLGEQRVFSGQWTTLAGYESRGSALPRDLHDSKLAYPWQGYEPSESNVRSSASHRVAPVALIPLGQSPAIQEAIHQLVFSTTLSEPAHRPKTSVDVDLVVHSTSTPTDDMLDTPLDISARQPGPQLEYFDLCPRVDDITKLLFFRLAHADSTVLEEVETTAASASADLSDRDARETVQAFYRHAAKMLETAWATSSTLMFLCDNTTQFHQWCSKVGPFLPAFDVDDSKFCTSRNTPNVSIALLKHSTSSNAQATQVDDVVEPLPLMFRRWLCCRSDVVTVHHSVDELLDQHLPVPKDYSVAGWVAPLALPPSLQPNHLLQMAVKTTEGTVGSDLWSSNLMTEVAEPVERRVARFYASALRTEVEDASRNRTIPLESCDLVTIHRHFFFSALRQYSIQLFPLCGGSVNAGTQLLEVLKRDINTTFREVWKENNILSKHYSSEIFTQLFAAVDQKFLEGDGFSASKHGLRNWFTTMNATIATFRKQAKGPRSHEVLHERLVSEVLPKYLQFSQASPSHPYLVLGDLELACQSLTNSTRELLTEFRAIQDGVMGKMQRDTAVYTTFTGAEWISTLHSDSCNAMRELRPACEAWEDRMLGKAERWAMLDDLFLSGEEDADGSRRAILPLPLLRSASIQAAMAEEGEYRASLAQQAPAVHSDTFVEAVSVVHREKPRSGLMNAIRRLTG